MYHDVPLEYPGVTGLLRLLGFGAALKDDAWIIGGMAIFVSWLSSLPCQEHKKLNCSASHQICIRIQFLRFCECPLWQENGRDQLVMKNVLVF